MSFHESPVTFVSKIEILVMDIERCRSFYRDILGLKLLMGTESKAVFSADGEAPLLTIEKAGEVVEKKAGSAGLYHMALLLPERADLARFLRHMLKRNYPLQGASDHYVSEAIYLADPEGNGIEVYIDRPTDIWQRDEGEVHMTTEPLDANDLLSDGNDKDWEGMPAGTVMGHIHLQVLELKETERFYCKGLGFNLVNRYGSQAIFVSSGGYHHHIGLNTWQSRGGEPAEKKSPGLKYFTLVLPNEAKRDNTLQRLKGMGTSIEETTGGIFVQDPSGNRIKLATA
ncbi:VOC family protein [Cytobacillus oceanisediminis]|uniref:VOC family protein n=1 Tax=Cytobacillus oceanisediminis TaxID=665099 RepID=UPI00373647AD